MPYCRKCDGTILGLGYLGTGLCMTCHATGGMERKVVRSVPEKKPNGPADQVEECPKCGQRMRPMTNAERQRRYRQRHKGK